MKPMRTTADVAAGVVAWHNRHPLARRIAVEQVHGIGIVDLPIAVAATPRPRGARLLFAAETLYHVAPKRLAAWLRVQKPAAAPLADDWPRRTLEVEPDLAQRAQAEGFANRMTPSLITAAIDVDGQRLRVLIGSTPRSPLFGPRAFSSTRLAMAACAAAVVGAVASGTLAPVEVAPVLITSTSTESVPAPVAVADHASETTATDTHAAGPVASAPADPASVPQTVPQTVPQADPPAAAHASVTRSSAAEHEPAPPVAAVARLADMPPEATSSAAPVGPASSAEGLGRFLTALDPATRERVRAESRALRAASAASAASAAHGEPAAAPGSLSGPVYAIATPLIRKREAAQAQMAVMRGLMVQTATIVPTHLDLMPVGRQWRVVWWPHPKKDEATRLLEDVSARGLRAELILF